MEPAVDPAPPADPDETLALGAGDGPEGFDTRSRASVGKSFTRSKWQELRAIDARLEEQLKKPGNIPPPGPLSPCSRSPRSLLVNDVK
jgi:hypothetical protein